MFFVSRMKTEHYTFEAAGRTEKEAEQALFDGWRKHLRDKIAYYSKHSVDTSAMSKNLAMSLAELDAWYGIYTFKCEPGVCLCDGSPI